VRAVEAFACPGVSVMSARSRGRGRGDDDKRSGGGGGGGGRGATAVGGSEGGAAAASAPSTSRARGSGAADAGVSRIARAALHDTLFSREGSGVAAGSVPRGRGFREQHASRGASAGAAVDAADVVPAVTSSARPPAPVAAAAPADVSGKSGGIFKVETRGGRVVGSEAKAPAGVGAGGAASAAVGQQRRPPVVTVVRESRRYDPDFDRSAVKLAAPVEATAVPRDARKALPPASSGGGGGGGSVAGGGSGSGGGGGGVQRVGGGSGSGGATGSAVPPASAVASTKPRGRGSVGSLLASSEADTDDTASGLSSVTASSVAVSASPAVGSASGTCSGDAVRAPWGELPPQVRVVHRAVVF
jgi:hypothetical protein